MKKIIFAIGIIFLNAALAHATKGIAATEEDIVRLKKDLQEGIVKIDQSRLNQIRENYGDPSSVADSAKSVTYNYGDLRLVFDKQKVWKDWGYDSFKMPVYTDSADNLRFDLESKELVGKNVTYAQVENSYGIPTESVETTDDGGKSVYYYGNIRMEFETVIALSSWKGDLPSPEQTITQELISVPPAKQAAPAPAQAAAAAPAPAGGGTPPAAGQGAP